MEFLEKLDFLMESHGMNKSTFSKASGIPYTTIDGFYKKGFENTKLSTLRKIAKTFNVTLDFIVDDQDDVELSSFYTGTEKNLVSAWRAADEKTRKHVALELEDFGFRYEPEEKEAQKMA